MYPGTTGTPIMGKIFNTITGDIHIPGDSMSPSFDFVLRSRLAREFLVRLYVAGRMYTRQLLGHVPAKKSHAVIVELEAHGLIRRYEGDLCRGKVCFKVVWNELTPKGLQVLKKLSELGLVDVEVDEKYYFKVLRESPLSARR